jgi:hypothetical protein
VPVPGGTTSARPRILRAMRIIEGRHLTEVDVG